MKMITRRGIFLWILAVAFVIGIGFMTYSLLSNGSTWVMKSYNHHVYKNGELIAAGTIYDVNDVALVSTKDGERVYSDDKTTRKSTLHILGDPKNFISTGVQNVFDAELVGYNTATGVYNIEKYGKGNDMTLTVDSEICNLAYKELAGRKGTVAVVNYKTGDIICSVSSPSYDVNNVPDNLETSEDYEGVYINRLINAHYTPGSTFKIVTAICAIENMSDVYDRTWKCGGEYDPGSGEPIKCNANHGSSETFKEAFADSCNSVFAQIAIELGTEKLQATAKELGIGSSVSISEKVISYAGYFDGGADGTDLLGWTGIGQGNTRIAPVTMLRIVSAIANSGEAPSFNIVKGFSNQLGSSLDIDINLTSNTTKMISTTVAEKIGDMMKYNGENAYDDVLDSDLNICAKSGTAQIDDVDAHNTAWFVGYMDDSEHPYAFVVAVEHGNSGHKTAAPIANTVLKAIAEKY